MSTINDDAVLARRLDVTARLADQVAEFIELASDGLLLENLIGRYVLNCDGRTVLLLIDGRRTVGQVVADVAMQSNLPVEQVRPPVHNLFERMLDLGLVELTPTTALVQPAPAG